MQIIASPSVHSGLYTDGCGDDLVPVRKVNEDAGSERAQTGA
jgi:hypothetical protein